MAVIFNVTKCKVLTITRCKNPTLYDYMLDGTKLERVKEYIDLGVTLDCTLNWNKHVQKIISKANKMLGLVKRSLGYLAPKSVKRQLYITIVRSQLEYCMSVWSGLTQQNVKDIERVQRAATRYILDYPDMSYKDRLSELNLLPLSYRRDIADAHFMFKYMHNIYNVHIKIM